METAVRVFKPGEELELLALLAEAYGNHYDPAETRRVSSSAGFDAAGCFIAEEEGAPVGCVAVTELLRDKWFVIRYLAVRGAQSRVQVAQKLLEGAVEHVRSKGPEYVRATTPAIEPYVAAYKDAGFTPVRRDFRIAWDLDAHSYGSSGFDISELQPEMVDEAVVSYVKTLSPYWDWRTEEQWRARRSGTFVQGGNGTRRKMAALSSKWDDSGTGRSNSGLLRKREGQV